MTWLDGVLLGVILAVAASGYRRGWLMELCDLILLLLGTLLASQLAGPLGEWLSWQTGATPGLAALLAFLIVLPLLAAGFYSLAMRLEKAVAPPEEVPAALYSGVGVLFASVKGFLIAWIVLLACHSLYVETAGPVADWLGQLSPAVAAVVEHSAPPEVARVVLPVLR